MTSERPTLPIDAVLDDVISALSSGSAVLSAPTGAGKTTRVPPAIRVPGQVWVVQPRRVAARAAARRMAAEHGSQVGTHVGWHVRFEKRSGPETRILCMTSGMLLQALRVDPFLEGVGAVVFDEVHERALDLDLGMARVDALRRDARPELLMLAMSATLDTRRLASWLDAPVVQSEGRSYPVDVQYLAHPDDRAVHEVVADAVRRVMVEEVGDVLAFLPGVPEIRRTAEALHGLGAEVIPLHGGLSAREQDRALSPSVGRRVVLATNVAESSVTVPGVRVVVDSGFVRRPRMDHATGLDALVTERVSMASADQRAGRAGRTEPGVCRRLWTQRMHQSLADFDPPEIERVSLASAVLSLLESGSEPKQFRWMDAPADHALDAARGLLEQLGATEQGRLTSLGRAMVALPLHPRLSRFAIECARQGFAREGAALAAMLSDRDPLRGVAASRPVDSDLERRLDEGVLSREQKRIAEQLQRRLEGSRAVGGVSRTEALGRAAIAGWPDRLARRREQGLRARMIGGKGLVMGPCTGVRDEFFVAIDLRADPTESEVRLAVGVDVAWLQTHTETVCRFDPERQRVLGERQTRVGDLVLYTQSARVADAEALACLAEAASKALDRVQPGEPSWAALLQRLTAAHLCLDGWPRLDEAFLAALIPDVGGGCRSFEQLRKADWTSALWTRLGWGRRAELDHVAPVSYTLPSGRAQRIDWSDPERPVLAARIQEWFGCSVTPTVLDGRPLVLHMLAPNHRPQQVTTDLAGFWERSYPEIRKELRARYSKHAWPEDPLAAIPGARSGKRRS